MPTLSRNPNNSLTQEVKMSDQNSNPNPGGVNQEPSEDDVKNLNPGSGTPPNVVPYSRLKEMVDAKNALRAELDQIRADIASQKQADLEKKEEYKALYEQTQSKVTELGNENARLKSVESEYSEHQRKEKERLLAKIPADKREKYANLDSVALANIVDDFFEKRNPEIPPGPGIPSGDKAWKDMKITERILLKKSDPAKFEKLKREAERK